MSYSADATHGDLGLSQLDTPPPATNPPLPPPPPHRTTSSSSSHPPPRTPTSAPQSESPPERPSLADNPKRQTLTRRISFPREDLDPLLLARLRRWVISFAVVEFDIDTGPNLDNIYPLIRFPPEIRSNIAFSSLPEGDLPSFSQPTPTSLSSSTSSTSSSSGSSAGDTGYAYHWRIPYPSESELRRAEAALGTDKEGKGKEVFRLPETEEGDGALHGFVWFVQEKDPTSRRNYTQRSLLLLTHLPSLSGLFSSLLAILGPMHFRHAQHPGAKGGMVETACHNIGAWPDPTPGSTLDLPFLGTVLTVSLPLPSQAQFPLPPSFSSTSTSLSPSSAARGAKRSSSLPYPGTPPSPFLTSAAFSSHRSSPPPLPLTSIPPVLPASLPLTPLCLLLFPSHSHSHSSSPTVGFTKLLLLWELLVLGEPILVFASEARVGAEVVEHLRGLIRPIPFAGDYRPYFHVHDRDFATLCKPGGKPPPGTLLASTNPLLLRNCKHWPHILRLDRAPAPPPPPPTSSSSSSASRNASPSPSNGFGGLAGRNNSLSTSAAARRATAPGSSSLAGGGGGGGGRVSDGKEFGLKSERKRHVKKDEGVRRAVEEAWGRGEYQLCDLLIYQHFSSLTERFLAPLNRYFGTLWAGSGGLSVPSSSSHHSSPFPPDVPPPLLSPGAAPLPSTRFSPQAFLTSLRTHGSSLPLKPSISSSTFSFSTSSSSASSLSSPPSPQNAVERFYIRFLSASSNPHYVAWLEDRTRLVGGEVRKRYLRRLEEVDLEVWARGKGVEEVGEMVGRLEREAGRLNLTSPLTPSPSPSAITTTSTSSPSIPPSSFSSPSLPSTTGLGIASSTSHAPDGLLQPGARLLKQAERLRELRDERVRSLGGASTASGRSMASGGSGSVYAGSSTEGE